MNSNWAAINAVEATKNICCMKGEGTVDRNTVTRRFKKFCSGCKNLDNQARSSWPKTGGSALTHPMSSTLRVSGEMGIPQFSVVHHLHYLSFSFV